MHTEAVKLERWTRQILQDIDRDELNLLDDDLNEDEALEELTQCILEEMSEED